MKLDGKSRLRVGSANKWELKNYPLVGNACIVSEKLRTSARLTSAVVESLPEFIVSHPLKEGLIPDAHIDQSGIVKVGSKVRFRVPLAVGMEIDSPVSRVKSSIAVVKTAELLDDALVTRADVTPTPGASKKVAIDLLVTRPLMIGDVLDDGHGHQMVIAGFSDRGRLFEDIDMVVHPSAALLATPGDAHGVRSITFTKLTQQREDKLAMRSVGAYAFITQLPLFTNPSQGQKAHTEAYAKKGYVANVMEMLTIKADAVAARSAMYHSLLKKYPAPNTAAITESFVRIVHTFQACGFSLAKNNDHLSITRLSGSQIYSLSHGEVTSGDTINYRNLKPVYGGLMCEVIFGCSRDMECSCGALKGKRHHTSVCKACGVTVNDAFVRRSRFGHITLTIPVVHPWLISTLPALVGIDEQTIRNLIDYRTFYDYGGVSYTGADAIKKILEIMGIDSTPYLIRVLPVLPVDLRPIFAQDDDTFAMADANVLYRRIIERNIRSRKLKQMGAPDNLQHNEDRMIQEAVESLLGTRIIMGPTGRPLQSLGRELSTLLDEFYTRRNDYSAQAICIPDATLHRGTIGVPAIILRELFRPMLLGELLASGRATTFTHATKLLDENTNVPLVDEILEGIIVDYPLIACHKGGIGGVRIEKRDGEAIAIHPDDAAKYCITFSGEHLTLFLPLSEKAKAEARTAPEPRPELTSTITHLTPDTIVKHALTDTPFTLDGLDKIAFI